MNRQTLTPRRSSTDEFVHARSLAAASNLDGRSANSRDLTDEIENTSGKGVTGLRERWRARLQSHPLPGITEKEVESHFRQMPAHYWEQVTKTELCWGLETVHRFSTAPASLSLVVADFRYYPERGLAKVMVCAWDRPGLLAKMAASFSALGINILRADVFTRGDGLALDVFEVCDLELRHAPAAERLKHFVFLLEGALSEPPRFVSVWAGQCHKAFGRPLVLEPSVEFDNDYSTEYTVIRVRASDRVGLLHDLLRGMAAAGLNIAMAAVQTEHDIASDVFYVTDVSGAKPMNRTRLERVRKALVRSVLCG